MAKSYEKLISEISQMPVIELAELVKALEKEFGVSAAMPMAAAGAVAGGAQEAAPAQEKTEYKVILKDSGAEKIKVIKALRSVMPTLGLTEAKAAVDNPPFTVAEAANAADSKKMKETLEAAGAKVELA